MLNYVMIILPSISFVRTQWHVNPYDCEVEQTEEWHFGYNTGSPISEGNDLSNFHVLSIPCCSLWHVWHNTCFYCLLIFVIVGHKISWMPSAKPWVTQGPISSDRGTARGLGPGCKAVGRRYCQAVLTLCFCPLTSAENLMLASTDFVNLCLVLFYFPSWPLASNLQQSFMKLWIIVHLKYNHLALGDMTIHIVGTIEKCLSCHFSSIVSIVSNLILSIITINISLNSLRRLCKCSLVTMHTLNLYKWK